MKSSSPSRLILFCLAILSASAFADVVVLRNGEKIEGKVIAETGTEITVAVKVSASITDERIVKRTEIASITKEAPDEIAWQSLKNTRLGRSSLPLASYDAVINPLKGFVTEFPQSKFAAEAQKIADAFAAEKKRIEAGEVKLEDKWLSKEEAEKEALQINGLIAFNFMKEQSARDMTAALNTLDVIEKKYAGTRSYPDAIEYAQKILPVLKVEVDRRAKALAVQKAEQTEAIKKLTGAERTNFENEVKRLQATAEATISAAEKQGLKWPPLNPATERSLQSLAAKVTSETSRLAGIPVAKMRASIEAAENARGLVAKKEVAGAETLLAQASSAWPGNELATRLRAELDEVKKTLAATPAVTEPVAVAPAEPEIAAAEPVPAKPAAPVGEEVDEETPFLLTAGGAVTSVIIVGLLITAYNVFKKIKARASEVLE